MEASHATASTEDTSLRDFATITCYAQKKIIRAYAAAALFSIMLSLRLGARAAPEAESRAHIKFA